MDAAQSLTVTACKVCGCPSPLFGVVDFHKSCVEAQGRRLSLSGIPVYYRRCTTCRFVFTDAFDTWSQEPFLEHIYNRDYIVVDPDFVEVRIHHDIVPVVDVLEKRLLRPCIECICKDKTASRAASIVNGDARERQAPALRLDATLVKVNHAEQRTRATAHLARCYRQTLHRIHGSNASNWDTASILDL